MQILTKSKTRYISSLYYFYGKQGPIIINVFKFFPFCGFNFACLIFYEFNFCKSLIMHRLKKVILNNMNRHHGDLNLINELLIRLCYWYMEPSRSNVEVIRCSKHNSLKDSTMIIFNAVSPWEIILSVPLL